jgi:hypothetical protein
MHGDNISTQFLTVLENINKLKIILLDDVMSKSKLSSDTD